MFVLTWLYFLPAKPKRSPLLPRPCSSAASTAIDSYKFGNADRQRQPPDTCATEVYECIANHWLLLLQLEADILEMLTGNANHLIPVELALKVASKIEAGEPFGCVILLPMYSQRTPTFPQ